MDDAEWRSGQRADDVCPLPSVILDPNGLPPRSSQVIVIAASCLGRMMMKKANASYHGTIIPFLLTADKSYEWRRGFSIVVDSFWWHQYFRGEPKARVLRFLALSSAL